jgi:hypothetical protein
MHPLYRLTAPNQLPRIRRNAVTLTLASRSPASHPNNNVNACMVVCTPPQLDVTLGLTSLSCERLSNFGRLHRGFLFLSG